MDWQALIEPRIKARRKVLLNRDDEPLAELQALLNTMPRRAVVLQALELADETAAELAVRYPDEQRPTIAIAQTRRQAAGAIRMPDARRSILACHACAQAIDTPADAARCHAIGQACAVVHTRGHALGFPMYDLTVLVREHGIDQANVLLAARYQDYVERALWQAQHADDEPRSWVTFLR